MEETPSNQNSAKKKALARDGFRCVVTGQYDYTTFIHSEELKQNAGNTGAVSAECAYILGESVNVNIEFGLSKSISIFTCLTSPPMVLGGMRIQ